IEYNRKNAVLYIDIIKNESLQLTIPKSVYPCVKNKITNLIKQSELQKYPITRKHTGWFSFGFRLNHIKLTNKEKQEFTNIVKELLIYFGKKQDHLGIYYERNPKLRKQAISCHGRTCKACNFNFGTTYGVHGEGFIEVHHINPLAEIGTQHKVNPKTDLIPLCSNCHRMVHRRKDFLTIPELKSIIKK
ncbi:MAG: HNH endonuclease, partial [Victivallaceae bacterium]|nr:HNH endonuclease [Victivallaceae bacterium]